MQSLILQAARAGNEKKKSTFKIKGNGSKWTAHSIKSIIATGEHKAVDTCRICGETQAESGEDLVAPCACVGKHKYVHSSCIKEYHRKAVAAIEMKCEMCSTQYVGDVIIDLAKMNLDRIRNQATQAKKGKEGLKKMEVSKAVNVLATLLKQQGKYEEAVPLFKEALDIDEQTFSNKSGKHPQVANVLNALAATYKNMGHRFYDEAEATYKRSLEIREAVHGGGHVDVATSYHNLAQLAITRGRWEEAKTMADKASKIRANTLGENHPTTKISQQMLKRATDNINSKPKINIGPRKL